MPCVCLASLAAGAGIIVFFIEMGTELFVHQGFISLAHVKEKKNPVLYRTFDENEKVGIAKSAKILIK